MAHAYTYAQLSSAITGWAADTDTEFVAEIDRFISRAELRILRDLDFEFWQEELAVTVSASSRVVTKPSAAVHVHELFIRGPSSLRWVEVLKRSKPYCRLYSPVESEEASPKYFAEDSETSVYVVPTPNQTFSTSNAKALCTVRPTPMSASNATTWIGDNLPDLLFEACMIEAYDYLKHPAKMEEAAKKYQSLLPGISKDAKDTLRKMYTPLNSLEGADS